MLHHVHEFTFDATDFYTGSLCPYSLFCSRTPPGSQFSLEYWSNRTPPTCLKRTGSQPADPNEPYPEPSRYLIRCFYLQGMTRVVATVSIGRRWELGCRTSEG